MAIWLGSTGKVIVNEDGKIVVCDECPCGPFAGCPCPDVTSLVCHYPSPTGVGSTTVVPLVYDPVTDRWTGESIYCNECSALPLPAGFSEASTWYSPIRVYWELWCEESCPLAPDGCWRILSTYLDYAYRSKDTAGGAADNKWEEFLEGISTTTGLPTTLTPIGEYIYPRSGGVGYLCDEFLDDTTGTGTGSSGHSLFGYILASGGRGHDAPNGYCLVPSTPTTCWPGDVCEHLDPAINSFAIESKYEYKPNGDANWTGGPNINEHTLWRGGCLFSYNNAPVSNNQRKHSITITASTITLYHEGISSTGVTWNYTLVGPLLGMTRLSYVYHVASTNVSLRALVNGTGTGSAGDTGTGTTTGHIYAIIMPACTTRLCKCNPVKDTIFATVDSDCPELDGQVFTLRLGWETPASRADCLYGGSKFIFGSIFATVLITLTVSETGDANDGDIEISIGGISSCTGTSTISCNPLSGTSSIMSCDGCSVQLFFSE